MKIICVGLNYNSHKEEMNKVGVETPILFIKPDTALLSNDQQHFYIPDFTKRVDYEIEVVVKINKMGKNIAERFAHRYYDEITVGIDFTARDLQEKLKAEGMPWELCKGFDNSAAIGNFVPKSELNEPVDKLDFRLQKNGQIVQESNTQQMIYSIDQIIAYASQFFTLKTGDLLFTGTPAGIGSINIGDKLSGYLTDRQLLSVEIC